MKPGACGYHGVLVFPAKDAPLPKCDHHKGGKPCHEGEEEMVPVHEA